VELLERTIAREFAEAAYRADLATVTGARSDGELAAWIAARCREELGSDVDGARFANKSVGAVFGLMLADGRAVVLKLFPATFADAELAAIHRCHAAVHAAGFPAPRPLGRFAVDGVRGAFAELVDGDILDAHRPEVRRTLAVALATLHALALDPRGLPPAPTRGDTLWGPPHRLGIDYARAGGEWIDARAAAALAVVRATALPELATHADWGTKNALFRDGVLRAILDWDSLVCASEAEAVGRAAAEFTAQWELPAPVAPTAAEATAFVREYEAARGRRFDAGELAVANASADYLLAQVARQELGGDSDAAFTQLLRETASTPLIAG
jgi:hypothetical protein